MNYLLIRQSDIKLLKAFLSGNEIEVGVVANATGEQVRPGQYVDIFYENDTTDTWTAEVRKCRKADGGITAKGRALHMLSLVKI